MSKDREKYITTNDNDKFIANMIKFTITKDNCIRTHELIRELYRNGTLDKIDTDLLLACCEIL